MNGDIQNIENVQNSQVAQTVGNQVWFENASFHFNEPLQPLFNCKHYNFSDPYISLGIVSITAISLISILLSIKSFYIAISLSAIFFVLMQQRILNIMEVINVYNHFFSINGVLIPFHNIKQIEKNGLKLTISYIEEIHNTLLPNTLTFIKKDEIDRFQEQCNKSISSLIDRKSSIPE